MSAMAYQITGISIICSTVGSGADQGKHQSSASLAFVRGIHRKKASKKFPFDDVIMNKMRIIRGMYCSKSNIHLIHKSIDAPVTYPTINHPE